MQKLSFSKNYRWYASAAAGAVFTIIAVYVLNGGSYVELHFNNTLQTMRSDWLDAIAIAVTLSGDTVVLVWIAFAMIAALAYNRQFRLAATVLIASVTTPLVVVALKGWIQRPRPTADLYPGVEAFSFPSGHTTNSAVLYGILLMLAYSHIFGRQRLWLASLLGILILLIGLSRIYLAAHWPTDVIAGWCIALLVLISVSSIIRAQSLIKNREQTVFWMAAAGAAFGLAYGTYNFTKAVEKYSPRDAVEVATQEASSNSLTLSE